MQRKARHPQADGIAKYGGDKTLFKPHIAIMESNKRRHFAFCIGQKNTEHEHLSQKQFAKAISKRTECAANLVNQHHDCFLGIPYCYKNKDCGSRKILLCLRNSTVQ